MGISLSSNGLLPLCHHLPWKDSWASVACPISDHYGTSQLDPGTGWFVGQGKNGGCMCKKKNCASVCLAVTWKFLHFVHPVTETISNLPVSSTFVYEERP